MFEDENYKSTSSVYGTALTSTNHGKIDRSILVRERIVELPMKDGPRYVGVMDD